MEKYLAEIAERNDLSAASISFFPVVGNGFRITAYIHWGDLSGRDSQCRSGQGPTIEDAFKDAIAKMVIDREPVAQLEAAQ